MRRACGSPSTPALIAVRRNGNRLVATLGSDYAPGWRDEREVDQIARRTRHDAQ